MSFGFGAPQGGFGGFGAPAQPVAQFGGFGAAQPQGFGGFAPVQQPQPQQGFGGFGVQPAAPAEAADVECRLPPGQALGDSISSIAWSPDGRYLTCAGWDSKVHLFAVQRGPAGGCAAAVHQASCDAGGPVLDHTWGAESNAVYIGGCNSTLKYWNLAAPGSPPAELGRHVLPIRAVHRAAVGPSSVACIVTGSWDRTLAYWDPRQPKQFLKTQLDERVYAMDVNRQSMVVALGGQATRKICIFDLARSPERPVWELPSPLKFQTRCVRIFHDLNAQGRPQSFGVSSIEGRCSIRRLDKAEDEMVEPLQANKPKFSFAFKCHREEAQAKLIYSVNALDTHPNPRHSPVFATGGSDGIFTFWDKDKRQRLKEFVASQGPRNPRTPVTDIKFSPDGALFAYAYSYDWSRGFEHNDQQKMPPQLFVHSIVEAGELARKPL